MTARYIVGDVRRVLPTLEPGSIDLVLTSPPFLALRSYLPADHPDKPAEIGSEPTPGAYIDTLLDIVELLTPLLTPQASMCIEMGDTYAGSGGAGGDYNAGGLRDGQERFDGSASRAFGTGSAPRPARVARPSTAWRLNDDGTIKHGTADRLEDPKNVAQTLQANGGPGWPLDRSLCLVPELFRIALVYGFNPLTGRRTPRWRARNVISWCRPNPPVGALGDKFRPATTTMVVVCKNRRWFDLDAVRTPHTEPGAVKHKLKNHAAANPRTGWLNDGGDITQNPAGAPPLDWWKISTQPYPGAHYATWPDQLCIIPVKAMSPLGGTVLDPFAGSGTTLAVATGHGRNAIGIDLDARNAEMALERVGPLLLTVEQEVAA